MPELASQVYNNNNIVIVDEEAIYDTLNMYMVKYTCIIN